MRIPFAAAAAALLLAGTAHAQSANQAPSARGTDVTITGKRSRDGKPIPMSDWYAAETQHVVVFGRNKARAEQLAHNLEKLHFLLSVLLNRVDTIDETVKLGVTLFGDIADFKQLNLTNLRWQQGPFPRDYPNDRYYDPREDGAVLATTEVAQTVILEPGRRLDSLSIPVAENADPNSVTPTGTSQSMAGPAGAVEGGVMAGGSFIQLTAESRLYAGFAQHYLLTYFPRAYPRWYLDGFGEVFATMRANTDGVIEYGRAPEGFRAALEKSGRYPIAGVFDGRYLKPSRSGPDWTPYQAWALVHLMFFSEEWREPLRRYLGAVGRGASPQEALAAFGEVDKLRSQLADYRGRAVPFETMTYPPARALSPIVRQLTRSEGAFVRGRLELGARVELPPPLGADATPDARARREEERRQAASARSAWLDRLRRHVERYPDEEEGFLLLVEAECRAGTGAACSASADRALAKVPEDARALTWKGIALAQEAVALSGPARAARLAEARRLLIRANRADTESLLPLIAFHRTFELAGEEPSASAFAGLMKAVDGVPSSPTSRLTLARSLVKLGQIEAARMAVLPVAYGPYETPERPAALALIATLGTPAAPPSTTPAAAP